VCAGAGVTIRPLWSDGALLLLLLCVSLQASDAALPMMYMPDCLEVRHGLRARACTAQGKGCTSITCSSRHQLRCGAFIVGRVQVGICGSSPASAATLIDILLCGVLCFAVLSGHLGADHSP
jgi:hypothetical protein